MKKFFLSAAFIAVLAFPSLAQEVKSVSTIEELDAVKQSLKGKVVLVNFWATWCKPCVREFPELLKLYSAYKDKDFVIVFLSLDVPEDVDTKVLPFIKTSGVDFTSYYSKFDKPETLMEYFDKKWEGAIPTSYIYDRDGIMKSKIVGSRKYEEFEKEILGLL